MTMNNNYRTSNSSRNTRNIKNASRSLRGSARILLAVVTLMTTIVGTVQLGSVAGRITWTQVQMVYYHMEISDVESQRDYAQSCADEYPASIGRSAYQNQADAADEEVARLTAARKTLHSDEDPIVAWAAKGDFNFLTLVMGLTIFAMLVGFWYVAYNYRLFAHLVKIEEQICFPIVHVLFTILACLFYFLARVSACISRAFRVAHPHSQKSSSSKKRKNNSSTPQQCRKIG